MLKAIIIDDETKARESLRTSVRNCFNDLEVIGEADSVRSGLKMISELNPDIVFLDVQMNDGTGFDLLREIGEINFSLIFVSAYDRFAFQAFRFSAIDYLLKPVEESELIEAVLKVRKGHEANMLREKLEILKSNKNGITRMALPSHDGIDIVKLDDIIRCESDNNYTNVYLISGEKLLVSRTLKDFDEMLCQPGLDFFRIHKSHLINIKYLKKYRKGDGGSAIMEDGSSIEVSRRRKEEFISFITNSR